MLSESTHENHSEPMAVKTYVGIFGMLLGLLVLTVGIAFIPTSAHPRLGALMTTIAFAIASAKAMLIILYFMHVKAGTKLIWICAASGFVTLVILFVLTFNDYAAR